MSKAKQQRRGRRAGVLDPDRLYSRHALQNQIGLSSAAIQELRLAGATPRLVGHEHWYEGAEIIDWIRRQKPAPSPAKHEVECEVSTLAGGNTEAHFE